MTGIRQTDRLRERKPCADRQICPSDLCVVVVGVRNFRPTIWTSFSLKATIRQLVSVHIAFKCHSLSPSSYMSCAESPVFTFRFELSSLWTFLLKATTSRTLFLRRTWFLRLMWFLQQTVGKLGLVASISSRDLSIPFPCTLVYDFNTITILFDGRADCQRHFLDSWNGEVVRQGSLDCTRTRTCVERIGGGGG